MSLAARVAAGDHRSIARAITLAENRDPTVESLLRELHSRTGRAHVCGITGPPGAGKSTLVQRLAVELRDRGHRVAIVAVDPSSPFSGGALLGDRVRMGKALEDPRIYMRSLASRGHLGGLSLATADVIDILDAAGFEAILVETVGAGQCEFEIMRLAHTTIVVTLPGMGDDIQAHKAGILEIADVFVVNKSDRDGADRTVRELNAMLDLGHRHDRADPESISWRPPVIKAIAVRDDGTDAILGSVERHRAFLVESGRWQSRLRRNAEDCIRQLVSAIVSRHCFDLPRSSGALEALVTAVTRRELDPYTAAEELLAHLPRNTPRAIRKA